jgi:hypothetical protein
LLSLWSSLREMDRTLLGMLNGLQMREWEETEEKLRTLLSKPPTTEVSRPPAFNAAFATIFDCKTNKNESLLAFAFFVV